MKAHASEELKQRYLPKMLSGEWSGTMCLTEPHCGTDLGLLRTRAEGAEDGTYRITGPRSSSPAVSRTSPRTSSTWCSPGSRTRPPG